MGDRRRPCGGVGRPGWNGRGLGFYDPRTAHLQSGRATGQPRSGRVTVASTIGWRPRTRGDARRRLWIAPKTCGFSGAREAPTLPLSVARGFARFASSPVATASIRRTSPEGVPPPAAGRPVISMRGAPASLVLSPHLWMGLWTTWSWPRRPSCRRWLPISGTRAARRCVRSSPRGRGTPGSERSVRSGATATILVLAVPERGGLRAHPVELHRPAHRPAARRDRPRPGGRARRGHRHPGATTRS